MENKLEKLFDLYFTFEYMRKYLMNYGIIPLDYKQEYFEELRIYVWLKQKEYYFGW